jgi:hypothetical protein
LFTASHIVLKFIILKLDYDFLFNLKIDCNFSPDILLKNSLGWTQCFIFKINILEENIFPKLKYSTKKIVKG